MLDWVLLRIKKKKRGGKIDGEEFVDQSWIVNSTAEAFKELNPEKAWRIGGGWKG